MRTVVWSLGLLAAVLAAGPAAAELGTADAVPAATLLVPYFEVDLGNANGITTLFSVNNASASAAVAHVTLWTDQAIPTFNFDIYLTGYDVQTINVRDLFNGFLPVTADAGADFTPFDAKSPKGPLSQDINFPGPTGPCGSPLTTYNNPDPTLAAKITHIRLAHTGQASPIFGGRCAGASFGDNVARGYVTVDSVSVCNLAFPSDPGYFTGLTDFRNILWGDVIYVNPAENFAQGDTLVHVEACPKTFTGAPGNGCPYAAGDYTFYGRYVGGAATDQREPLATTYASRYINGSAFTGGTDLLVWRDTRVSPTGPNGPYVCGGAPAWYPLTESDVVAFDEQETPTDTCTAGSCFPLAAARVPTAVAPLSTPAPFGWLFINLNHNVVSVGLPAGVAQGWVGPIMDASGRFSVGFRGAALDNARTAPAGGLSP